MSNWLSARALTCGLSILLTMSAHSARADEEQTPPPAAPAPEAQPPAPTETGASPTETPPPPTATPPTATAPAVPVAPVAPVPPGPQVPPVAPTQGPADLGPPPFQPGKPQRPPVQPVDYSERFDSKLAAPGLLIAGAIMTVVGGLALHSGVSGLKEMEENETDSKAIIMTTLGGTLTIAGVTLTIVGLAERAPVVPPEYEMIARRPAPEITGIGFRGGF